MKINHNISALNAYRNLSNNNITTSKNLEKLSSGLRINRAADDAAGLAISEKMRSQIRGLDMAERNTLDAVSFVQIAEGGLSANHSLLQRMRELAVQAANDTNTETDRDAIQQEINELTKEVNRISNTTEFNTKKLLNGELQTEGEAGAVDGSAPAVMQIGANAGQTVSIELKNMGALYLGITNAGGGENSVTLSDGETELDVVYTEIDINEIEGGESQYAVDVSTHENAAAAITLFSDAIQRVSTERARLGAIQNRLEYTADNLRYMSENTTASESRIRDVDMALEMTAYTKNNILVQSAQAMLAQANQLPQGVLQLLK
ncbi:flagellin [Peribacillus asahii]|uniref:flagellin N-terminal helical domain-containing protein n=1 Tax=Peribacillus asahii TaxID=228899 RepID=UPI0037F54045